MVTLSVLLFSVVSPDLHFTSGHSYALLTLSCWPRLRAEWIGLTGVWAKQQTKETGLLWYLCWGRDYNNDQGGEGGGGTSLRRRVATSISMRSSLWKPGALWTVSGRGCLSSCWVLYCLLRRANTWVKTFQAFWDPVRVSPPAWGLAVIAPFSCLSCAEHSFIATIRGNCSPKFSAAIKRLK